MSYVVRRRTIGKAQELLKDLRENLENHDCYEYFEDDICDTFLFDMLENWLETVELIHDPEDDDETKVVDKDGEPEDTE